MTRLDLKVSVSILLGKRIDRALQFAGIGLPERLKMAALVAVEQQMLHREPTVTRIREALLMLRNQGELTFDPERNLRDE